MKKLFMVALLSSMVMSSAPAMAEGDSITDVLLFPFRLVTGAAGAGVGTLAGGTKGIIETEQSFASATFGKASENPLMVPVGLVGIAAAVPVGFVKGAPEGLMDGAEKGYNVLDNAAK